MVTFTRDVDAVDLGIIRFLQDEPRASNIAIARVVGVSEATVKRRIDSLIEDGIITPAMIPDVYRLGFGCPAILELAIDLSELNNIAKTLCEYPETTWVVGTMGNYDMIVAVATATPDDLMRFTVERVATIQGVRNVDTLIAPRVFKLLRDWRVPLETLLNNGTASTSRKVQKNDKSESWSESQKNNMAATYTARTSRTAQLLGNVKGGGKMR
jgi:Lrp/AsnC family transcriptional regulator, regulator for asnA, asnC and gidA